MKWPEGGSELYLQRKPRIVLGASCGSLPNLVRQMLIERDGKPVAVIMSIEVFETICRPPSSLAGDPQVVARSAFGMWAACDDIGDEWLREGRERQRSEWSDD